MKLHQATERVPDCRMGPTRKDNGTVTVNGRAWAALWSRMVSLSPAEALVSHGTSRDRPRYAIGDT